MQNRIQKIEGLEGLSEITNLELAANRIRVSERCDFEDVERRDGVQNWTKG